MKLVTWIFFFILGINTQIHAQLFTFDRIEYRPFNIPTSTYLSSYDVSDLNGDLNGDLIFCEFDTRPVLFIMLASSQTSSTVPDFSEIRDSFDYKYIFDDVEVPLLITMGDIDGDNDKDIIFGEVKGAGIWASLYCLENTSNDGLPSFRRRELSGFDLSFIVAVPTVLETNKDGLVDIVISDFDGRNQVYKNKGSFTFEKEENQLFGDDLFRSPVSMVDISSLSKSISTILSYNYESGFQIYELLDDEFILSATDPGLYSPDSLRSKFFQLRLFDTNKDGIEDIYLSSMTFGDNIGYYSDTWYFQSVEITTKVIENKRDNVELIIYPNPSKEGARISFNGYSGDYSVSVISITGEIVHKFDCNTTTDCDIFISHSGLYAIKALLHGTGAMITQMLISVE